MAVGYNGSPVYGYKIADLLASIATFLDASDKQGIALVGVGNLGRAVLAYFAGRHPNISFVAAFDSDETKVGRVVKGCRCYSINEIAEVVRQQGIRAAVLAVPAENAQEVADRLIAAGVTSILNFAPVPLQVPPGVYVEHNDLTTSIERVAFFARARAQS